MDTNDDPDYEFVDCEIEKYRKRLMGAINKFLSYKAVNTFPTNFRTHAIFTWKNYDYDDQECSRINMEFNDLATTIWDAYKAFIRVCKRKLN